MPGTVRRAAFGRASEEPYRRRTSDVARLVIAAAAVALLARRSDHVSAFSRDVFRAFNDLPDGLRDTANVLYGLGALWAVATVGTAALVARRWRLARDLAVAGLAGWLVARGLGLELAEGSLRHIVRAHVTPRFPNVRLTVVVAVVAAAAPFLTRGVRRVSWLIVLLMIPSALYLGVALPRSIACAVVLGWGIAAAAHVAFGSPGGRPTMEQVRHALAAVGIDAHDIALAPVQPHEHTLVEAKDATGPIVVAVLGRDETDARVVSKLWRFLYYKDSGPDLYLSRQQELEHQAYVTLLARDAGVRVSTILAVGTGGPATAILAQRDVGGPALNTLTADTLTQDALVDLWSQVVKLHGARIAHGRLNTSRIRLSADGPALVGFSFALTSAQPHECAADVAELLATTSVIVGPDRALGAALTALGPEQLADALPLLQPAALTREGRRIAGHGKHELDKHLDALRTGGAAAAQCKEPELEQLQRVRPANLALAIGTLIGVGALLSAVGDPSVLGHALTRAHPLPLVIALVLSLATTVGYAIALAGAVPRRLPFWPGVELQSAGVFSNLALPFGSTALQVRFLQRQGIDTATAVAAGGIATVFGTAAQAAVFGVATAAAPQRVHVGSIPKGAVVTLLGVLLGVILVASAVLLSVPALRKRFVPPIARGVHELLDVLRSPRQLGLLLGGSALSCVLFGLALTSCLYAVGEHPSPFGVIAANVGVSLVAALVPFPGGGTAVASVGLSGALVSLGVSETDAVAAVLLHQLLTKYVPAIPGWLALRTLMKHDEL
ncbi:MAG TPA: lysylphosphatidylglycerol synthase transmembrane domain-containing protein [Mycobacteriales bacterium]|nr:lysylphosphatidylglycerol synthase transmembrane domain-containing protein [Mycobacteriales bacterium]